MVEGESRAVVGCGIQVAGRYAGLEDQSSKRLWHAASVIYNGQGSVATPAEGRGDVDVAGAGVYGVAEEFVESVLNRAYPGGTPASALYTREADEAPTEVSVRTLH